MDHLIMHSSIGRTFVGPAGVPDRQDFRPGEPVRRQEGGSQEDRGGAQHGNT